MNHDGYGWKLVDFISLNKYHTASSPATLNNLSTGADDGIGVL